MSKLDAKGHVTRLKDAPFEIGDATTSETVDPVTGDYLFLTKARQFFQYDITNDSWTELPVPAIPLFGKAIFAPVFGTVAGPIATHGVAAFVTCLDRSGQNCHFYIYKHQHR